MVQNKGKLGKKSEGRMKRNYAILKYLQKIQPNQQSMIIKGANRDLLETLSEIALNIVKKNIKLSSPQINKLRPYERQIYDLSLKKHSLTKKRKILQTGSGLISGLLSVALPVLMSIIGGKSK